MVGVAGAGPQSYIAAETKTGPMSGPSFPANFVVARQCAVAIDWCLSNIAVSLSLAQSFSF